MANAVLICKCRLFSRATLGHNASYLVVRREASKYALSDADEILTFAVDLVTPVSYKIKCVFPEFLRVRFFLISIISLAISLSSIIIWYNDNRFDIYELPI